MVNENIVLDVKDIRDFAVQYLTILDSFNHLTEGEKKLLVEIMIHKNSFIEDNEIREKLLLDFDVKYDASVYLDITDARLNNILSNLRKKNTVIKTKLGNKLHQVYDLRNVKLPLSLTFSWKYGENTEQATEAGL
jgi:hypothetical protein